MVMSEPQNNTGVTRLSLRLLRYALRRWRGLVVVLAIMFLKSSMEVLKPLPMKLLVDNVLNQIPLESAIAGMVAIIPGAASREGLLIWLVAATVLIFILGWGLDLASTYSKIGFGQRMVYDLAEDLYRHLQRLSIKFHSRKSTGDLIRRVTTDTGSVSTIVNDALLPVPVAVFTIISMFVIMWQLDTTLTLLALIVVPFMILTVRIYSGPMNELSYRQKEAEGEIYDVVEQTLSSMPAVQAFSREGMNDERLREVTHRTLEATIDSNRVQLRFKVFTGLATAAGTAGIIWVGGSHVLDGRLTVGSILVFIAYLGSLYGPLETVMYTSMTLNYAAGSGRRVMEVLDTVHEVEDHPSATSPTAVKGHVRIENLTFGYETNRPILKNISFEAFPGQTIAIVGQTGAGKSTLVSLIPRFFDPWEGKVLIDGTDIRDIKLNSLRNNIAIVLQEPFLFPLSIAENIAYGSPDATAEEIEAAARDANAHEFIEAMPDGYDTIIGERGATLSGGERQRLSIARAILKNAPILILDEPTSSLDAQTEELISEALERLKKARTTFIIAHRLSTVRRADRIIVVESGRISETGSHEELIVKQGLYTTFCKTQFG